MTTDTNQKSSLASRLSEVLEIQEEEKKQEIIKDFVQDKETQSDFDYVRDTIKDMVEKGKDAVDSLIEVAKESETPRHYEVLATIIKTTTENAEKLLDIRKKKKELEKVSAENPTPQAIGGGTGSTTNVFVGTSADLLRAINAAKKQDAPVDVTPTKS